METKDISKRTVLVLLILTLVISVVGTWTILSQPTTIYKTTEIHQSPGGKVSVGILDGPPAPATPAQPAVGDSDGQVSIKILK
jgi:hypothetical protein